MKNALLKEAMNIQSYAFLDLTQYIIFFVRTAMKCKKTEFKERDCIKRFV